MYSYNPYYNAQQYDPQAWGDKQPLDDGEAPADAAGVGPSGPYHHQRTPSAQSGHGMCAPPPYASSATAPPQHMYSASADVVGRPAPSVGPYHQRTPSAQSGQYAPIPYAPNSTATPPPQHMYGYPPMMMPQHYGYPGPMPPTMMHASMAPTIQIVNAPNNGNVNSHNNTLNPTVQPPVTNEGPEEVLLEPLPNTSQRIAIRRQPGEHSAVIMHVPAGTVVIWHQSVAPQFTNDSASRVAWCAVSLKTQGGGSSASRRPTVTVYDKKGNAQEVHGWVRAAFMMAECTPQGTLKDIALHIEPSHGSRYKQVHGPYVAAPHGERTCDRRSCKCTYLAIYAVRTKNGLQYSPLCLPDLDWGPVPHGWVKRKYLQ